MQYLKHFGEKLLNAVSASGATGAVNLLGQTREHTIYIEFSAGTASGVVTVEHAAEKSYAGTWESLGVFTWAAASTVQSLRTTGAFGAIRARVTTAIVGGNGVTVTFYAN